MHGEISRWVAAVTPRDAAGLGASHAQRPSHAVSKVAERGFSVDRLAEEVALATAAAELHEPVRLPFVLDALGNDIHAEALAHSENGTDDVLRRLVVEDGGDEGAVDLQLVEVELAQPPERRLTGAEIVERNAD